MLYLAFLLPWRYGVEGYLRVVAPVAEAVTATFDGDVRVQPAGHLVRHSRPFPRLRVAVRDDIAQNPVLMRWLVKLVPGSVRAMYSVQRTRAYFLVEFRDFFRMTLELPLFLALVLALPRIPWRRRLRPVLAGMGVLFLVHAFLLVAVSLWFTARVGNMAIEGRAIVDTIPDFWNLLVNRYQYVGPVLALLLLLSLLFFGLFDPSRRARLKESPKQG